MPVNTVPTATDLVPRKTRPPRASVPPRAHASRTPLNSPESVFVARRAVRAAAAAIGFTGTAIEELVLVVSELVSNALKYAGGGQLELTPVEDEIRGPGIIIAVEDTAPPFDLERALPDGHDVRGQIDPALIFGRRGIGAGLGAVARLTDGMRLEPTEDGKRLVAMRFVRRQKGARP